MNEKTLQWWEHKKALLLGCDPADLVLLNENVPPATKSDAKAFRPMNASEKLRQGIYKQLQTQPEEEFRMLALAVDQSSTLSKTTRAAKALVRGGFATTVTHKIPRPTKKDPGATKEIKAIKFVVPWTSKVRKEW